jgi:C_GCAxxG_C_C family probable redox protein
MTNKAELIQNARATGFQYERDCTNCCQSTIAAIQDILGVQNESVFKAGSGMAGGIGILCDGVCGGYSGGVMVLSTLFGRDRAHFKDPEVLMPSFELASLLHERYMQAYGSTICKDIHMKLFGRTFDLWDKVDFEAIEMLGAHEDKCTSVVANASAWTTEIILDELEKRGQTLENYA